MEDRLLTAQEAARYLGVSLTTVRRLMRRGEIVNYKVGGKRRNIKRSDLDTYLASRRVGGGS